ncbi:LysR family transcriptional regulator [Paracidovorax avenae]|uniref:LysR substrate-binding domain-containing protein n=1 Tax=Paracidovorax avenae TaxID=80867 RepID=UPI000D20FF56|nr:LysR substrate-binding domain-containing protein [Paracidovorax avenae]AVS86387.1 LysR family transcriptional regulator [Paracidovorax avenae]
MARTLYDLDVLRTFTTGVALGSFVRAADKLGRSTSAVSAQLKKLESQAGTPLLRKSGRGLVLTEAGEILLAYAHRLLDLNDEAAAAVSGSPLHGLVRLGLQEDLGETLLPGVLGRFARAHPQVRIEVSVARSTELRERFAVGQLDLALLWDAGIDLSCMRAEPVMRLPLHWIGPAGTDTLDGTPWWQGGHAPMPPERPPLPLVLLEDPCPLRRIVTAALEHAGLPWRHAFHSSSLGALWAATAAGLGLSVRTAFGLPAHVRLLSAAACGLPELPSMDLVLGRARDPMDAASERLATLLLDAVREHMGPSGNGDIVPSSA